MNVIDLPKDVLVQVASFMSLGDLCKVVRTCHALHDVSSDDSLWRKVYECDFGRYSKEDINKNYNIDNTWKENYRMRKIERISEVRAFNTNPTFIPGLQELAQGETQYRLEKYAINFLQDTCITRVSRGVYLSFADKRTLGLLDAYFETLDFTGLPVLDSLKEMLIHIQFPSHFSVITRFMLCFAQRYFNCNYNATIFKTADAVYVLAFGIIMLNTDMHNSAVKNKMTLAQYIHNSSGINEGENLPDKMLCDIYNKIKEKPLVLNKMTPSYESSLWSWVSDWITKLRV